MSDVHTDHVEYLLPDYVNGKLEEGLNEAVESHLRSCASCRLEEERVREAVLFLHAERPPVPAPSYFVTILPRVRQRLEHTESRPVFSRPLASTPSRLVGRLALPLAAAAVAIALLLQFPIVPGGGGSYLNSMKLAVGDLSSDDLAQAVLDESRQHPFVSVLGDREVAAAVPDRVVEQHLFTRDFYSQTAEVTGPLFELTASQTIEGLSDSEIDALLQRLAERAML
jgi:anti-sigma factor RsiW